MNPNTPHTPRIRPIPLPPLPSAPERQYIDGQLTPLTPHPNILFQAQQQIHEILRPKSSTDITTETDPESPSLSLSPSHGDEGLSPLYYDFKDPPSKIILGNTACTAGISLRRLKSIPATETSLKQLRIILPTTTPISVIVSNSPFVSILDILDAIHSTLHAPISSSIGDDLDLPNTVYNTLPSGVDFPETNPPVLPSSLIQAPDILHVPLRGNSYDYHPTDQSTSETESNCGRKIDYLKGRTTFAGLTRCNVAEEKFAPITWKLHTTT